MSEFIADPASLNPSHPEEVLAYLPYRFGYRPQQSLVTLAIVEPVPGVQQVGLAARLDLADLQRPSIFEAALAGIGYQMGQDDAVGCVSVLYTDEPLDRVRTGAGGAGQVMSRWCEQFRYADPAHAWIVTASHFGPWRVGEQGAGEIECPDEGYPVHLLDQTVIGAQMVLAGHALAGSRDELACPRICASTPRTIAARAASRERRRMKALPMEARQEWRERRLSDFALELAAAERGDTRQDNAATWGRLGAMLDDPLLRDVILVWSLTGHRLPVGSPEVMNTMEKMLIGNLHIPTTEHVRAIDEVVLQIVRHCARGRAGYALAMVAWMAWWRGEGARADVVLGQSLQEDSHCSLALLLRDILTAQIRPGWARPATVVARLRE